MPKIVIVDTYYPDFLRSLPLLTGDYKIEKEKLLNLSFGTGDFYSKNLRKYGWEAIDLIANYDELQYRWGLEHHPLDQIFPRGVVLQQIEQIKPDVVFMQDLSFFNRDTLASLKAKYLLAGQCSCPMPPAENVRQFDILFTSFPHYVEEFRQHGVKAIYNKLAFEHTILKRLDPVARRYDVTFIGGVGYPSHWKSGMEMLERVAREIPTSHFWGYGIETLPKGHPILEKHHGQAWGMDLYDIYFQSKIVINRHGEVSRGYLNNMRCFEATGCGAMLMTEYAPNFTDFFVPFHEAVPYSGSDDLIERIKYYLEHEEERADIAWKGQRRTLVDHTYENTMMNVSAHLLEMLK